jgi:hypothetical protein
MEGLLPPFQKKEHGMGVYMWVKAYGLDTVMDEMIEG